MAILTHDEKHYGHVPCRPPLVTIKGTGVYFGEEMSMRLPYSGLNGSGYDLNPRRHGCLEEHSGAKLSPSWKTSKIFFAMLW